MLRLLTLGGLAIRRDGGRVSDPALRLQGLALLARLAVAGERGVSRNKLVGCFWPDRDERLARHSLSQAIYDLRRALGGDALVTGREILRLESAQISSDVVDLEAAVLMRDAGRVSSLYDGPFLDGIYLEGADEFERWVEVERKRLADGVGRCLREGAVAAAVGGDDVSAEAWLRRLVATDPLDSAVVSDLVELLDRSGQRAAALREAREHAAQIRRELGTDLPPALRDLVARLETAPVEELAHQNGSNGNGSHGKASHPGRSGVNGSGANGSRANGGGVNGSRMNGSRGSVQPELPALRAPIHDLTPSELSAIGRQCIHAFTPQSYEEAERHLKRAIAMDPLHVDAHVTLGSLNVVLSQARHDPEARARGVEHCRRATELDPLTAEAFLWRAWAAMLDCRHDEAEALGARAVALDPANPFAHNIMGWVHLAHGLRVGRWTSCIDAVRSFHDALVLHPRFQTTLVPAASVYALAGQYAAAGSLLERALDVERSTAREMRMPCALTFLGLLDVRRARFSDARQQLSEALISYADAPQFFAPYVRAHTHCGLGDLERFDGRYDAAVVHYARALSEIEPVPALMGCGYLAVRVEWRLAAACRRLRMRADELRHASAARTLSGTRGGYSFNWCWEVSEAQLHYDAAVYHASCGDHAATVQALRSAVAYGWNEPALLRIEPAFEFCRNDLELERLSEEMRLRPPLPEERAEAALAAVYEKEGSPVSLERACPRTTPSSAHSFPSPR